MGTPGDKTELGSSTSSSASLKPVAVFLLVKFVVKERVKFTCGTGRPGAVAVPPVHDKVKSARGSAVPSTRTIGGTPAFAVQVSGAA
jgi:hypothetical protein